MEPHKLHTGFDQDHVGLGVDQHLGYPASALQFQSQRPLFVRRMSRSEPHLNVPHFINANDHVVSSMHHVLSGLFEVDSTMSLTSMIHEREQAGKISQSGSMNNLQDHFENSCSVRSDPYSGKSSGAYQNARGDTLQNQDSYQTPASAAASSGPLRKSSSAVEWKNTGQSHFPSTSVQPYHHNDTAELGGLTMSVKPENSMGLSSAGTGPLSAAAQKFVQNSPEALGQSIAAGGLASMGHDDSQKRSGMFSMFGRGFFARPAMRDEQENYRYIMALDR
ncbi:hypothetical protein L596_003304 [Steinernema carpocapsae]|uniref:Uncharacterized protein n=1 Tax=Steinernema carpocapsae TaxID=34508 RepID=A0A4U8UW44_STECR|nr:hypothetical protein L596_003304 [Steinernema carpocapsae]